MQSIDFHTLEISRHTFANWSGRFPKRKESFFATYKRYNHDYTLHYGNFGMCLHPTSNLVCSCSHILKVPFEGSEGSGIVYIWIGSKTTQEEAIHAEQMGRSMFEVRGWAKQMILE